MLSHQSQPPAPRLSWWDRAANAIAIHPNNPGMGALTERALLMGRTTDHLSHSLIVICQLGLPLHTTSAIVWTFLTRVTGVLPAASKYKFTKMAAKVQSHMFDASNEGCRTLLTHLLTLYFAILPFYVTLAYGKLGILVGFGAAYLILVPYVATVQLQLPFHNVHGFVSKVVTDTSWEWQLFRIEYRNLQVLRDRLIDIVPFGSPLAWCWSACACCKRRRRME